MIKLTFTSQVTSVNTQYQIIFYDSNQLIRLITQSRTDEHPTWWSNDGDGDGTFPLTTVAGTNYNIYFDETAVSVEVNWYYITLGYSTVDGVFTLFDRDDLTIKYERVDELVGCAILDLFPNQIKVDYIPSNTEPLGLGYSAPTIDPNKIFANKISLSASYILANDTEIQTLLDFWDDHYGSCFTFCMPSYQSDLILVGNVLTGIDTINVLTFSVDIEVGDILFFYAECNNGEDSYFTRTITDIDDTVITLDSGISTTIYDGLAISKVYEVRFSDDALSLSYETNNIVTTTINYEEHVEPA